MCVIANTTPIWKPFTFPCMQSPLLTFEEVLQNVSPLCYLAYSFLWITVSQLCRYLEFKTLFWIKNDHRILICTGQKYISLKLVFFFFISATHTECISDLLFKVSCLTTCYLYILKNDFPAEKVGLLFCALDMRHMQAAEMSKWFLWVFFDSFNCSTHSRPPT